MFSASRTFSTKPTLSSKLSTPRRSSDAARAIIAVILALGVGVYVEARVSAAERLRGSWTPGETVILAERDMEVGHMIELGDIVRVVAPSNFTPPRAVAVSEGTILTRNVAAGVVLTDLDIRDTRSGPLPGRRWVAVAADVRERPALSVGSLVELVSVEPFTGTAIVVAAFAEVVELDDEGIVVDVVQNVAASLAAASVSGVVVAVLAPNPL